MAVHLNVTLSCSLTVWFLGVMMKLGETLNEKRKLSQVHESKRKTAITQMYNNKDIYQITSGGKGTALQLFCTILTEKWAVHFLAVFPSPFDPILISEKIPKAFNYQ